jgi:hypothetical protein
MARSAATAGPMRLVQRDGFAVYAGKGAQNPQEPARRRLAPVARAGARAVKHRSIDNRTAVPRQSATWSIAIQSAVLVAILMGLFGAYSLGRYAGTSGPQTGLVYTKPAVADPEASGDKTLIERLSLNAYIR